MKDSTEELAKKNIVTEYKGSLEQYAVDNWIAGYSANNKETKEQSIEP